MAAPSYVSAADLGGATDPGGAWNFASSQSNQQAGDLVIVQLLQDGSTGGAVVQTTATNISALDGTASAYTAIGSFNVGSPTVAIQHLFIGRWSSGSSTIGGTNSTSEDLYIRSYLFRDGSTGTTLATVIENVTAGSTVNGVGTSGTIADASVTTLGPDRLALNFVAINDDNAVAAFTGMTGGTWAEAVAEYADATGTDGCVQLQTASMASAATIDGGTTSNPDATDGWGVVGFALIGTTVAAIQPKTVLLQAVNRASTF